MRSWSTDPRTIARIGALLGLLLGPILLSPAARADESLESRLLQAHAALRAQDLPTARALAATFTERERHNAEVRYFLGRFAFYEGRYQQALDYFQGLTFVDQDGTPDTFPDYVRQVLEATRGLVYQDSEHFRVYYDPDTPDRILPDYALDTLEKAYRAIGAELGHFPPDRVRVEIFPTATRFIQASGLTREEIETTGTVALCIYNKLMITTPRALALGYPWMDTLSHE